jgi:hypothetical protein
MDETWVNENKVGKLILQNRLWTCKYCFPIFTSDDKERHGNTSKLNNHMKDVHDLNKQKHKLGVLPKVKGRTIRLGAMDQFVVTTEPIPTSEEALLQCFAVTNQPFELVEHKTFQNLYRSTGVVCPIRNAKTFHQRQELRFNDSRCDLKIEFDTACKSFSISFDGWGANNHVHILAVIAHWITANWERRSVVIEFAEMVSGSQDELWQTSFGKLLVQIIRK